MAQTFTNLLTHVIFSTKQRRPLLKTEIRPRLFAYMGGIVVQTWHEEFRDRRQQ